jgi:radical SAM superfamily enzyme YgiQ (UPF0313 family)
MRVALVFPPFEDKRDRSAYYVAPPLGLLLIAACLEKAGHQVSVHDFVFDLKTGRLTAGPRIYRDCAESIAVRGPDCVCISTQCTTNPGALNICRHIKELDPNCRTLLGGHDVSFISHSYLDRFPFVDFVLTGEAEHTTTMLIAALADSSDLDSVPGLAWRSSDGSIHRNQGSRIYDNLDNLPEPAYHLVAPLDEYFAHSRRPTILIDSGRGCAFKCEFCQTTLLTGDGKIRYRSIPSLLAELSRYKERHGFYEAYFVHDLFTAKRSFVEDFCKAMIEAELDISWQCRCRVDQVDQALLALMRRAGCRMLLYGIESGAESTLILMNKNLRRSARSEVFERVRQTVDSGIFPSLSMVVGTPEESLRDLNATMKLASEFITLGNVNAFIQLMSPLPGTALANRLVHRMEYRGQTAPNAFNQGIEFDGGRRVREDEALIAENPDIFQSFQCVTPNHGDLALCIDITIAYCKLLEVYNRSFRALTEARQIGHLDLFCEFREWHLRVHACDSFYGLADSEVWDRFHEFFKSHISGRNAQYLRDVLAFDVMLQTISTAPPLDAGCTERKGSRFRLRSAARLITTPKSVIAGVPPSALEEVGRYLVFATRDRIHTMELPGPMYEALEVLAEMAELDAKPELYDTLRRAVGSLEQFQVFEDIL